MTELENNQTVSFEILANPIRRKIIEEIAANESLSYKELVRITQLKSGPLYHHIHKLDNLITQDEEKRYLLTDRGLKALNLLEASKSTDLEDCQEALASQEQTEPRIVTFLGLSLEPMIKFFTRNPYRTLAEFMILAIVCGYLGYRDNILLIGNFTLSLETEIYFSYLGLFGSWLFLAGLAELGSRFIFKKKEGTLALLGVTGLTFIPIFIFTIVVFIIDLSIKTELYISSYLLLALHGVFQIWTFMILSTALGVVKKLSLEKSIIITLILNHILVLVVIFVFIP